MKIFIWVPKLAGSTTISQKILKLLKHDLGQPKTRLWLMVADLISIVLQSLAQSLLYSLRQTTHQCGDSTEVVLYLQQIASYFKQTLGILPRSSAATESYLVLAPTWLHVECLNTLTLDVFILKFWAITIKSVSLSDVPIDALILHAGLKLLTTADRSL